MIVTRHEFRQWVKQRCPEFYKWDSPLWSVEYKLKNQPEWFAMVQPVATNRNGRLRKEEYWAWCDQHMQGELLCYYSDRDNQREWWGFTKKEDIALWLLKWTG